MMIIRGKIIKTNHSSIEVQTCAGNRSSPIPSGFPTTAEAGDSISISQGRELKLLNFTFQRWEDDQQKYTERATFHWWFYQSEIRGRDVRTHKRFSVEVDGLMLVESRRVDEDQSARRAVSNLAENAGRQVWVEVRNGRYVPDSIMIY